MCVPSASFGGFASTLATWSGSVVSGSATVGFALKNTTDSGCPGLRAVNARAAAIAESIEFLMLFDVSISRTVPIPFAAAADWTATPSTGLRSSVTVTSLFFSTPRGSANVRTYARSGKSAEPASTTSTRGGLLAVVGREDRRRGERAGCGDERREDPANRPHRRRSATLAAVGRCAKMPAGRSIPRFSNLCRKTGRRPVALRLPLIVPSGANESILNSKMSWSVITSDSMRCTSVTAVTRREPSSIRSMWQIMSSAEETCCRIARTGRS